MLGFRKSIKAEDRARRRSQRGARSRAKSTDKPKTRKFGIYFSAAPASLKSGAPFKHGKPQRPMTNSVIPLRKKYRPIA